MRLLDICSRWQLRQNRTQSGLWRSLSLVECKAPTTHNESRLSWHLTSSNESSQSRIAVENRSHHQPPPIVQISSLLAELKTLARSWESHPSETLSQRLAAGFKANILIAVSVRTRRYRITTVMRIRSAPMAPTRRVACFVHSKPDWKTWGESARYWYSRVPTRAQTGSQTSWSICHNSSAVETHKNWRPMAHWTRKRIQKTQSMLRCSTWKRCERQSKRTIMTLKRAGNLLH